VRTGEDCYTRTETPHSKEKDTPPPLPSPYLPPPLPIAATHPATVATSPLSPLPPREDAMVGPNPKAPPRSRPSSSKAIALVAEYPLHPYPTNSTPQSALMYSTETNQRTNCDTMSIQSNIIRPQPQINDTNSNKPRKAVEGRPDPPSPSLPSASVPAVTRSVLRRYHAEHHLSPLRDIRRQ
jgi:hypothetical protein